MQMACTPEPPSQTLLGGKSCCLHPSALTTRIQVTHAAKSDPGIVPRRGQEPAARAACVPLVQLPGPLLVQERGWEGDMPAHPSSSFHYSRLAPSPEQGSRNNSAVYKAARTRPPSHTNNLNRKRQGVKHGGPRRRSVCRAAMLAGRGLLSAARKKSCPCDENSALLRGPGGGGRKEAGNERPGAPGLSVQRLRRLSAPGTLRLLQQEGGQRSPKRAPPGAASATPELVLAGAAAAGNVSSSALWELPLLQAYGLSWMCAMGGASAWLCTSQHTKCGHVPRPDPGTKTGLPEQKLGASEGDCSELCGFRVSIPQSEMAPGASPAPSLLQTCPVPEPMSSPALTTGQIWLQS